MPDQEKLKGKFISDFKIRNSPAFVQFTGKQTRGPKVLVWCDADIPLTQAGFHGKKQVGANFTVVDCLSEGFSKVPYEFANGVYKSDPKTAKPLSEKSAWPEAAGDLSMLTCWPYGIVEGSPKVHLVFPFPLSDFFVSHMPLPWHKQEKDERNEEYKWNVYPGMVLRMMFWADAARGGDPKKFKEEMCPAGYDEIKAFSLVEMELVCKVCAFVSHVFLVAFLKFH